MNIVFLRFVGYSSNKVGGQRSAGDILLRKVQEDRWKTKLKIFWKRGQQSSYVRQVVNLRLNDVTVFHHSWDTFAT